MIQEVTQEVIDHLKETSIKMKEESFNITESDVTFENYKDILEMLNQFSDIIIELAEDNLRLKNITSIKNAYNGDYL